MIKIDDGIPFRRSKYPWDDLKPGQSFFVPDVKASSLYGAGRSYFKWHGIDVTLSVRTENGGARIWRIA